MPGAVGQDEGRHGSLPRPSQIGHPYTAECDAAHDHPCSCCSCRHDRYLALLQRERGAKRKGLAESSDRGDRHFGNRVTAYLTLLIIGDEDILLVIDE